MRGLYIVMKTNPNPIPIPQTRAQKPGSVHGIYISTAFAQPSMMKGRTLFLWRTCLWNSTLMSLVFNRSRCRESGISLWNTIRSHRKSVSNNGAVCYAFTSTVRFYYEEFGKQAVKRAMQTEIVQNMSYH